MEWGGLEHALWDAIGKIAGQPAYRLLGGSKPASEHLTCVWPGKARRTILLTISRKFLQGSG